jgi:hypothetical protein
MKRSSISALVGFLLLFALFTGEAAAQWSLGAAINTQYDDNPFWQREAQPSWLSTFDAGIEYHWSDLSAGYYGRYLNLESMPGRNFFTHEAGLWGGTDVFGWGLSVEQRLDNPEYSVYDYTAASGYLQRRFELLGSIANVRGSAGVNVYHDIPELDNAKLQASFGANRSFETMTTLMGELGVNFKSYLEQSSATTATSTGGSGRSGRRYNASSSDGILSQSVFQVVMSGRISQSVTRSTGIAVAYAASKLLTNQDRFLTDATNSFAQESEMFDDPMSYDGFHAGMELTQILPLSLKLKSAFYYNDKYYPSQGIYLDDVAYSTADNRSDIRRTAWLTVEKEIELGILGGLGSVISFSVHWLENRSNSSIYRYSDRSALLSLELSY